MKKKIILIGGGSHANSCAELIEQENIYSILGIIDEKKTSKRYTSEIQVPWSRFKFIKIKKKK